MTTGAAVLCQADVIGGWLDAAEPLLSRPTSLPGWSVGDLIGHLTQTLRTIATALTQPVSGRPDPVSDYLGRLAAAAGQIRDREIDAGAGLSGADRIAGYRGLLGAARDAIDSVHPAAVVTAPRGRLRLGDFLATRAVELVVHADDIGRALPGHEPPIDPAALRVAVRLLADVLASRRPGRAVEVRIPPHAAVQCIDGPRHTRGTPPGVVETTPIAWLRLATGRLAWSDAVATGAVTASGERTDLGDVLPVLR